MLLLLMVTAMMLCGVQKCKVPLCADSKLHYERYRAYSLIDGEQVSTVETDDSCAVDQPTSDEADPLMFTDDSQSTHVIIRAVE